MPFSYIVFFWRITNNTVREPRGETAVLANTEINLGTFILCFSWAKRMNQKYSTQLKKAVV